MNLAGFARIIFALLDPNFVGSVCIITQKKFLYMIIISHKYLYISNGTVCYGL